MRQPTKSNKAQNFNKGFTLIEMIVYTAILTVVSVLVVNSLINTRRFLAWVRNTRTVLQAGQAIMDRLTYELRLAESIDLTQSTFGSDSSVLYLNTVVSPTDSTDTTRKFFVSDDSLFLQEGGSFPVQLTPNGIKVYRFTLNPASSSSASSPVYPVVVAEYDLNEGAGATVGDSSGNGNNGSIVGSSWSWTSDAIEGGMALDFDSNDYVDISDNPDIRLSDGAISLWVKFNSLSGTQAFFSKDHCTYTTGGHLTMVKEDGSNRIRVRLQSISASYFVYSSTVVSTGVWYHIVFNFGSEGMKLYVNGNLEDTYSYTGGIETNDNPLYLAVSQARVGCGGLQSYLDGVIDRVRIFGSALTQDQVNAEFNLQPLPPYPSPSVYYVRISGNDANDGLSPATAFRTISKAASVMQAGDTVYVGAGTYNETITPPASGVSGRPISYIADVTGAYTGDSGTVILDGQNSLCYAFQLSTGRSYLVIDGFEAINYRTCTSSDGAYYFIDGSNTNNIYRNLIVHNVQRDGFILGGSGNLLENCIAYSTGDDGMEIKGDGNIIRNCTFVNNSGHAIESDSPQTNTYENNIIDGAMGWNMSYFNSSTFNYNDWTQGVLPGTGTGNLNVNPLFVDKSNNDLHLSQTAAGQGSDSPLVDAGSDTAQNLGFTGTTRTDNVADTGTIDIGFHYNNSPGGVGNPFGSSRSQWVRVLLEISAGSGSLERKETFITTAVLRRSY